MHRPAPKPSPLVRLTCLCLTLWLAASAPPMAAGETRIELRDGSALQGELLSAGGGRYRIRTASLGEIEVKESDVAALRPLNAPGSAAGPGQRPAPTNLPAPLAGPGSGLGSGLGTGGLPDLGALQQQLLADPGTLQAILALKDDPEFQAALSDPALVQRLLSGDTAALLMDPRVLRLMARPELQAILGRVLTK